MRVHYRVLRYGNIRDFTWLTALWHVTEVLAKLITYNMKSKIKRNKKGKKAKLETTNVTIRPSSKSKNCQKLLNLVTKRDEYFQKSLERFVNLLLPIIILIHSKKSNLSYKPIFDLMCCILLNTAMP